MRFIVQQASGKELALPRCPHNWHERLPGIFRLGGLLVHRFVCYPTEVSNLREPCVGIRLAAPSAVSTSLMRPLVLDRTHPSSSARQSSTHEVSTHATLFTPDGAQHTDV